MHTLRRRIPWPRVFHGSWSGRGLRLGLAAVGVPPKGQLKPTSRNRWTLERSARTQAFEFRWWLPLPGGSRVMRGKATRSRRASHEGRDEKRCKMAAKVVPHSPHQPFDHRSIVRVQACRRFRMKEKPMNISDVKKIGALVAWLRVAKCTEMRARRSRGDLMRLALGCL